MSRLRLQSLVLTFVFAWACASTKPLPDDAPAPIAPSTEQPPGEGLNERPEESNEDGAAGNTTDAEARREREERDSREAEEKRAKEAQERAALEAERTSQVEKRMEGPLAEARALESAGRIDDAMRVLDVAAKIEPEGWTLHYNMGLLHERLGEHDAAIAAYRRALEAKSDFAAASANLTRLYIRSHRLREAEVELRTRITAHPRNTAFRNQLVRVLMEQGGARAEMAEAESKRVLKFDERNVDAMVNLGQMWLAEGKFELAKQVLDNAREIDPDNPAVWNLIAFTQLSLDMKPLALDSFRKAAALREDFPEAHNNLGAMLNEVNDCDGAIRELELAVKYAPDWAEAHMNLGNAYRCAREYEKAQTEYERAIAMADAREVTKGMSDPWFNLAILYLDGDVPGIEKLERLKRSVGYFEKYQAAGGEDTRTARYLDEAAKSIEKEEKRLARVAEQKKREEEKRQREEAARKAEEERKAAELAARHAEIERLKVEGKSDIIIRKASPPPRMLKLPKEDI